ncbi:histidine kinase [bacterium]|nr:histidine kinase [bacterium]
MFRIVGNNFTYTAMCSFFCSLLLVTFYDRIAKLSRILFFLLFSLNVATGIFLGMTAGFLILEGRLVIFTIRTLAMPMIIGLISSAVMTGYMALRSHLDERLEKLHAAARENEHLKRLESESRLASLQAKLNPHFLFNTLNSLAALVYDDPKKAEKGIIKLSEVYRHVLAISERTLIPAGEELDLIRDYLDLEKMRFDDLLNYRIDCPDQLKSVRIPGLLIEPLIGNVVKHALARTDRPVTIDISLEQQDGHMLISVRDDGCGFDPETIVFGYGLKSVQERLHMLYSSGQRLRISSQPGKGTDISITIPLKPGEMRESHDH